MTREEAIREFSAIANRVNGVSVDFETIQTEEMIVIVEAGVDCEELDALVERLDNENYYEEEGWDYVAYSIGENFGVEIQYKG